MTKFSGQQAHKRHSDRSSREASGLINRSCPTLYSSAHLQHQLELARAWLAQLRVPVSVRCGIAERLLLARFLASQEQHHE